MRRILLVTLALAAVFCGPSLHGNRACSNEGTPVLMTNPANGLPAGWRWDSALPVEACA